ncbi:heme-dependent oxidative N-demethylase subunit alpha family protein [Ponticaulis sp.]|uniref:heme-dependent oxidative N-demethylase subunit alpha family protein n=1 Tax=Ponticaulis sp. TaxID=2020902 RepID=UPI00260CD305|nr:heme-dependent oxidative N-demethylase subunit alpha family protein [Ponticaulis sp.]MDF1681843.1 DUF3445 domain-containing protein [Ponticaulis sp.]
MGMLRTPPHLPFLDGPAVMAPKLRPIDEGAWLFPDTEAEAWLEDKRRLMVSQRDQVCAQAGDWATDAAEEAAALVLNTQLSAPLENEDVTPIERAASTVSDDLCVMVPRDGQFVLGAASLCAPTFWSLKENIGKPLSGLHSLLPQGGTELSSRINRIFAGLQSGSVLERFNWTVQLGGERFTPSSVPMKRALAELNEKDAASDLFMRVERQTIRKLPETGAVLFSIRICVDPLPPILADGEMKKRFAQAWQSTAEDVAAYKGWPHYQHAIDWLLASA